MEPRSGNELDKAKLALTDSFFGESAQGRGAPVRPDLAGDVNRQALAEASGIQDDAVLDHLMAANFSAESISALGLVPLIAVAWADGALDGAERRAILAGCEMEGIVPGSVACRLLERWLDADPGQSLLVAWRDFIRLARHALSPEVMSALEADLIGRARKVAEASGGILGNDGISLAEQETLRVLGLAFHE